MQPYAIFEYESPCNELAMAHAKELVPQEYLPVWDWYQRMEGEPAARLPMGNHAPSGLPIKICSQRGIHKPDDKDLAHGWPNHKVYALTIHSAAGGRYSDQVIYRPDGTWTFHYDEQVTEEGRVQQWDQNSPLMNCLEDGVPVGVIVGQKHGYTIMGLAFVERYNAQTGSFTLHGPVNTSTESERLFYALRDDDLSQEELKALKELKKLAQTSGDERIRKYVKQVQRERQAQFSKAVYAAYDGKCAISNVGLPNALQAAHIDDYRSRKSQIVQNGILLRADIHLLYDADLLGIKPGTHQIVLADDAQVEPYRSIVREQPVLRLPKDPRLMPDDELLDVHWQGFRLRNRVA